MNENEQMLSENLRGLAEAGLQEAPARVEERLMAGFRRRSRARRIKTWTISGAAAVAAGIAVMLWVRPAPPKPAPVVAQGSAAANRAATGRERYHDDQGDKNHRITPPAPAKIQKAALLPQQAAMSFYPLPEAEELPPVENATVVRVQLPMSSLRLIGFPVNEERSGERVQADVLVGQDGLARGVRFVQ